MNCDSYNQMYKKCETGCDAYLINVVRIFSRLSGQVNIVFY